MRLVRKPRRRSRIGNPRPRIEQPPRHREPPLHEIGMRRHVQLARERTHQLEPTEPRLRSQRREPRIIGRIIIQTLPRPGNRRLA